MLSNVQQPINPSYESRFIEHKTCVLIPTYNNAQVLEKVLSDVLKYTSQIIVVNDGATDNTLEILQKFPEIDVVTYPKNKGKGFAVRTGMKHACKKGFEYVITMDSDGQHYPEDLILFIEKSVEHPKSIILGARNMEGADQPGASSFANKFSNFWFFVETGHKLPDTQSGYRLYPLKKLANQFYFSRRYEFEVEVIVRAAWRLIPIHSVPVRVFYPERSERITHFKPFKDFTRISILNAFLVFVAFLYGRPAMFYRKVRKMSVKQFLKERIIYGTDSNLKLALSVAFGIFMGIVPIWGWQLVAAIGLAYVLKLNKALVIVAANISIPPNIPVLIFLSYYTGAILTGHDLKDIVFTWELSLDMIQRDFVMYLIGAFSFAVIAAITSGLLSYLLFFIIRKRKRINK